MENVTAVEKNSEPPENPSVENNITPPRIASSDKGHDAEPESSQSTFQIAILMGALCASVFLAALDITIISTPLATISEYFHSSAAYTWVGSTYMLADAAGTPVWGKLSDIWGRKPLLLVATAIFFLGSALSGAAVNIDMLIAGRAVQGFAGGGLLTLVNICISDMFSMRDRAKYYGVIGMTWALASACGPVIGGVLTQRVSWRWCFYINLPVTGSAFLIILFTLNIQTPKTPMIAGLLAVDWLGSFSVAGATVMFLLGLTFGGVAHPWSSAVVLCLLIFGAALFIVFILIEWKVAKYPLMPLRLYRNASNMASLASCFCHGSILVLGAFFLPLYFQATLGATALLSGIWLLPFALSMSFSAGFTGWYISATGRYIDGVRLAFALSVLGFGLLIDLTPQKSWPKIIIFQIICGVGIGPNFQALLIALQSQVKPQDYATATAAFGFMRNLATSIGLVIGNVIFQNRMLKKSVILTETLGPQMAELFYGGSAEASVHIADALPDAQKAVVRNAYYTSIRAVWFLAVAFAGAGLVLIFFIRAKELSRIHEQIKTGLESMDPPREEGTIRTPKQGEP